jgi:hypothetical protein
LDGYIAGIVHINMTMRSSTGELPDEVVDALVMALLGVNNYSLEKIWKLLPRFRQEGLTKPRQVASEEIDRLTARLINAGYDRGHLTAMFAERLQHLMAAITSGRLDELCSAATRRNAKAVHRILCEIRGVGPRVAHDAWMLLQEESEK